MSELTQTQIKKIYEAADRHVDVLTECPEYLSRWDEKDDLQLTVAQMRVWHRYSQALRFLMVSGYLTGWGGKTNDMKETCSRIVSYTEAYRGIANLHEYAALIRAHSPDGVMPVTMTTALIFSVKQHQAKYLQVAGGDGRDRSLPAIDAVLDDCKDVELLSEQQYAPYEMDYMEAPKITPDGERELNYCDFNIPASNFQCWQWATLANHRIVQTFAKYQETIWEQQREYHQAMMDAQGRLHDNCAIVRLALDRQLKSDHILKQPAKGDTDGVGTETAVDQAVDDNADLGGREEEARGRKWRPACTV